MKPNSREKAWIGIDPGSTGAIIAYTSKGELFSWAFDGVECSDVIREALSYLSQYDRLVVLEKVNACPGQSASSMFKFGMNFGKPIGVMIGMGVPFALITPQRWQYTYIEKGMEKKDRKEALHQASLKAFPKEKFPKVRHKKTMSDAFLICDFCRKNFKSEEEIRLNKYQHKLTEGKETICR